MPRELSPYFMVDGKNYFCPNSITQVFQESKASSAASEVMDMLSGAQHFVVVGPKMFQCRNTGRVAVRADFGDSSAMTGVFARKIRSLYDSQTPFWMEYDSLMSRDFAVLYPADDSGLRWVTPTYPVYPVASDPGDAIDWTGCLYVNGVEKPSGWDVDESEGLVTFSDDSVGLNSIVCLSYRWRMPAIVAAATFTDMNVGGEAELTPPRLFYTGSVLFEQYFGTAPTWTVPAEADEFDLEDSE